MPKQDYQPNMREDIQLEWNTPLQHLYLELEARVQIEIKNIEDDITFHNGLAQSKIHRLREQLHRLLCAVVMKENIEDYVHLADHPRPGDLDLIQLSNTKLEKIGDLANFKINEYIAESDYIDGEVIYKEGYFQEKLSLREVLNKGRGFFTPTPNFFIRTIPELIWGDKTKEASYPPVFGETTSLTHFNESLVESIQEKIKFDVESYKQNRNNFFQENIVNRSELYRENREPFNYPTGSSRGGPG